MTLKSLIIALAPILLASSGPGQGGEGRLSPLFTGLPGETRAALLIKDGAVVEKHYAPGYNDETRFISWSMAKTVTAVLVGELVADGKLSLDAPVPFVEWQKAGDPRSAITLCQMLHMASGIEHTEVGDILEQSDTNRTLFVDGAQSMAARGLAKPLEAKPGTKNEYSSVTSLLLSELITRQLTDSRDPRVRAKAYRAFAEERLFKPAGITSAVMEFDAAGTQIGGSIIYMSLDDWGRFGEVLLAGKNKQGAEIVAPSWLDFLRTPSPLLDGYGGHTWLNRAERNPENDPQALFPGKGPETLYAAIGHLGQYVIASPDQNMVLVRLGKTNDPELAPVRSKIGDIVAAIQ